MHLSTRLRSLAARAFSIQSRSLAHRSQVFDAIVSPAGTNVTVSGWVASVRAQKRVAFLTINDGSSAVPLQVVCGPNDVAKYSFQTFFSLQF